MRMFDWKHARMRAESNVAFGVLILVLVLLAQPFAALTAVLADNATVAIIIALLAVGLYVVVTRWRRQGAESVYGLNMVATSLLVYAVVLIFSPERTLELAASLEASRLVLAAIGIALIVMGLGLRRAYVRKEQEEPPDDNDIPPTLSDSQ